MLRLEKKRGENPIHIVFREKERLLTPGLLRAFGFALVLHLSGVVFFHVQPFQIHTSPYPFPPVQVQIEKKGDRSTFTEIPREIEDKEKIPRPLWLKPEKFFLSQAFFSTNDNLIAYPKGYSGAYFTEGSVSKEPFVDLLEESRRLDDKLWSGKELVTGKAVVNKVIRMTGPLAKKKWEIRKEKGFLATPTSFQEEGPMQLNFRVTIENRTGEVIHYGLDEIKENAIEKSRLFKKREVVDWLEEFFQALHFEPLMKGFVTEGWVTILLGSEKEKRD